MLVSSFSIVALKRLPCIRVVLIALSVFVRNVEQSFLVLLLYLTKGSLFWFTPTSAKSVVFALLPCWCYSQCGIWVGDNKLGALWLIKDKGLRSLGNQIDREQSETFVTVERSDDNMSEGKFWWKDGDSVPSVIEWFEFCVTGLRVVRIKARNEVWLQGVNGCYFVKLWSGKGSNYYFWNGNGVQIVIILATSQAKHLYFHEMAQISTIMFGVINND